MGYSGQASLGQGAFVAAGALTVAVGTTRFELPPLVALLGAPLVAAAFAALVGLPLLRLHGHYLAFGTLALLLMVQAAMSTFDVLGGAFGISGIPPLGVGDRVVHRAAALCLPGAGLPGAGAAAQPSDRAQPLRPRHPGPGRQRDRRRVGGGAGEPQQGHHLRALGGLRRPGRWLVGVLHALREPGLLPGPRVVHLRDHGRGRRPRDDLGRSGRRRDRVGAPPGPQQPQQPARAAADGGADHAVRDVRRPADPGAALHAARHRADRGQRRRPSPRPASIRGAARDQSGGGAVPRPRRHPALPDQAGGARGPAGARRRRRRSGPDHAAVHRADRPGAAPRHHLGGAGSQLLRAGADDGRDGDLPAGPGAGRPGARREATASSTS